MFRTEITSTQFSSLAADHIFTNIYGDDYRTDVSFLSTLRAVLDPRLEHDQFLHYRLAIATQYNKPNSSEEEMVNNIALDTLYRNEMDTLNVFLLTSSSPEANSKYANAIYNLGSNCFTSESGWVRVEKVTAMFMQRKFMVVCFTNKSIHSSFVFVEGGDLRKYHMIQSGISVFLPWLFEGDKKLTEEELRLMNTLCNSKDADEYIGYMKEMSLRYDFRSARINALLSGFEEKIDRCRRDDIANSIKDCDAEINSLNTRISTCLAQKYELNIKLLGIDAKLARDSEDSEIMDYFLSNHSLVLEKVSGSSVTFCVKDYLLYYDEEHAQRMIENKTSYLYTNRRGDISSADMAMLFTEIFIAQSLKIKVCAAYKLTIGSGVSALSHYDFGAEYRGFLPNPHIQNFACLGANNTRLNELMNENNYIGAFEQCISSCRSLNFGDGAVMGGFITSLYDDIYSCIELPDGSVVKPSEAIKWIKEHKTQTQSEEVEHEQDNQNNA